MSAPYSPTFLTPSTPGQLSNKRGSTTSGGDAIGLSVKASTPASVADPIGSIRVLVQRTILAGVSEIAETRWDSAYVGTPATAALMPAFGGASGGSDSAVVYNGRVYFLTSQGGDGPFGGINYAGAVISAPLNGANVGTPRYETPVPSASVGVDICQPGAMALINGRLYVLAGANIYYSTIQADGTLAAWTVGVATSSAAGSMMLGYDKGNGTGGFLWVFYAGATMVVNVFPVNADGTFGVGVTTTTFGADQRYASVHLETKTGPYILIIGGENVSGTPTANTWSNTVNLTTGLLGASWTGGQALPAARTRAAHINQPIGNAFVDGSTIWIIGGQATSGGAAQTTAYASGATAVRTSIAWITGGALASGVDLAGGFMTGTHYDLTNGAVAYLGVIGGGTAIQVSSVPVGSGSNAAFRSGSTTGLTTANLGTGGSVTNNQDGSQTLAFNYGAFGGLIDILGFADGDQFVVSIWVTDSQTGDVCVIPATTVIKVGQPPTITNAAVSTGGQPTCSFGYSGGAGGAVESTYRVQIGALFDSGVRFDRANSVLLLQAPMFANGVLQTATITVTSGDTPMPGSSASATATVNFTPSYTAPAIPSGASALASSALGGVTVSFTGNGGGAVRIYARPNGTTPWWLLVNGLSATGSGQTVTLYDQIPFGIAYDYAVSSVDSASSIESALVTAATALTLTAND